MAFMLTLLGQPLCYRVSLLCSGNVVLPPLMVPFEMVQYQPT